MPAHPAKSNSYPAGACFCNLFLVLFMAIFSLLTPLIHVVGRLGADSMTSSQASLTAQPGEFIASVDGRDWKATGITIQMDGNKASIHTVNSVDNSALNIEISLKRSIEAIYYFIPNLRTMIATGKENALLYLPAGSGSSLEFLSTIGSVGKPGNIQIIQCDQLRRTITGRFAGIVGTGKKLLSITGSFNQLSF